MKILDVIAASHADLLVPCIQALLAGVNRMESRRGIGADTAMRRRMAHLLQKLGARGKEAALELGMS